MKLFVVLLLLSLVSCIQAGCSANASVYIESGSYNSNGKSVQNVRISLGNNGTCTITDMYIFFTSPLISSVFNYNSATGKVEGYGNNLAPGSVLNNHVGGTAEENSNFRVLNLTAMCVNCPTPAPTPTPKPTASPTTTSSPVSSAPSPTYVPIVGGASSAFPCPSNGICADNACFQNCSGNLYKFKCGNDDSTVFVSEITYQKETLAELLNSRMEYFIPGSQYLAQGFDVVTGTESGNPIFVLRYCDKNPDSSNKLDYGYRGIKYRIPDALDVVTKPQCSLDSSTTMFKYSSEIANKMAQDSKLSVNVAGEVDSKIAKGAASAAFSKEKSVSQATSLSDSGQHSIAITTASCETTHFAWTQKLDQNFGWNNIHPQFEKDLNNMASVTDATTLVEKYGSHFYSFAVLGGKLQQITALTSGLTSSHSEAAISSALEAKFSESISGNLAFVKGSETGEGSLNEKGQKETVSDSSIESSSQSAAIRSYGGAPFNVIESDFTSWAKTIDVLPVVIEYELSEILQILPDVINKKGISIRKVWAAGVLAHLSANSISYPDLYQLTVYPVYNKGINGMRYYGPFGVTLSDSNILVAEYADEYVAEYAYVDVNEYAETGDDVQQTFVATKEGTDDWYYYTTDGQPASLSLPDQSTSPLWDRIRLTSYIPFLNEVAPTYKPITSPTTSLAPGLIDHLTLSYSAVAKEYIYLRSSAPDAYFYRTARWFYVVRMTTEQCDFTGPFQGTNVLTLTGDKDSIEYYISVANAEITCPVLVFRIYSEVDVGEISSFAYRILDRGGIRSSLTVTNVQIIDLDDNVFESEISEPLLVVDSSIAGDSGYFSTLMNPKTGYGAPTLRYGYQLTHVAAYVIQYVDAQQICGLLGGVVASVSQMQLMYEAGADFCGEPAFAAGSDEMGTCYNIHSRTSNCSSTPGVKQMSSSGLCDVTCFGPYPKQSALAIALVSLVGKPVAVTIAYGDLILNSNSSVNAAMLAKTRRDVSGGVTNSQQRNYDTAPKDTYLYYNNPNKNKCSFSESYAVNWYSVKKVAITSSAYNSGQMCGACLNVTVFGKWGRTVDQFKAIVVDECTTCEYDYSISVPDTNNNKTNYISWVITDCGNSTSSGLSYYIHPDSTWENVRIQISNNIAPIYAVSILQDPMDQQKEDKKVTRTSDNWWILESTFYPLTFPLNLQLTSVYGDVVTGTIPSFSVGATIQGTAQFPLQS